MNNEHLAIKGRLAQLEEVNRSIGNETHANRSTIQHMANQLHIHEQNAVAHRLEIDTMRADRDDALSTRDETFKEIETLKARLDSIQKAWQSTRGELDQRENKFSSNESHVKKLENDLLYEKTQFESFKQQVGQLLSDGYVKVDPNENEIKDKIHLLMQSSKDRGVVC